MLNYRHKMLIVEIKCGYGTQDLVPDALCDFCESPMSIVETNYTNNSAAATADLRYVARNVPAFRHTSPNPEHGGTWYPTEVSVDILRRITRSLRRRGFPDLAKNMSEISRPLVASLRQRPTGLIKTTSA